MLRARGLDWLGRTASMLRAECQAWEDSQDAESQRTGVARDDNDMEWEETPPITARAVVQLEKEMRQWKAKQLSSRWRQCNSAPVLNQQQKLERMTRTSALKTTWWANYNVRQVLNNILADAIEVVMTS
jgi:hypothetical protein